MFPLLKNREKGNEKLAFLLYFFLNTGIILRIIFEPFITKDNNILKLAILLSAILQLFSILLYVYLLWNRVREKLK